VLLKTILNRVQKQRSFVYGQVRLLEKPQLEIEIEVSPRRNTRAICSGCGRKRSGYDTLPARRFEFVPLWGIAVFLV
jgi:transposase